MTSANKKKPGGSAETPLAERVLASTTAPALVFAAPLADDDASVLDLRATDLPQSPVMLRTEVRRRWRQSPKLVVRVDDEPTPSVAALLFELARREVRLTADETERFDEAHRVVVKTAAAAPPKNLVPWFPIRVRASTTQGRADARRR